MNTSVMLVGVGGQGTILMSKILSQGLLENGYDVKMSEIHGMSQRGGSVTSNIVYGDKVYSAMIDEGEADILVSFEKAEAGRYLPYLKKDGKLIVNDVQITPLTVLTGAQTYPNQIISELEEKVDNILIIDAEKLADQAGNSRSQNIVLLGAMVRSLGLDKIDWKDIISKSVKEQFVEANIKAFSLGYDSLEK